MSVGLADLAAPTSERAARRELFHARSVVEDHGLVALSWPAANLGEGLALLAARSGLATVGLAPIVMPEALHSGAGDEFERWIGWTGTQFGCEIEPVESRSADLSRLLRHAGPAMLRVWHQGHNYFLLLVGVRSGRLRLLAPDGRTRDASIEAVSSLLAAPSETLLMRELERLLDAAAIAAGRRNAVRSALLRERLAATPIDGIWLLRQTPAAPFWRQLLSVRLPLRLAAAAGLFVVLYGLEIAGWGIIGDGVLAGRLDYGWLGGWLLIVVSLVPLRGVGGWINATLAVDFGRLLKSRLLQGALRTDPEATRRQGAGNLLARVMESQAFEAIAVSGGLSVMTAMIELGFAAWLLAIGAGGGAQLLLLAGWTVLMLGAAMLFGRRLSAWTKTRVELTHSLIERMIGHRTVLAQEWPERREREQDSAMQGYLSRSIGLDRSVLAFLVAIPAGWLMVGIAGLVPAFVTGTATPADFAIGVGGVLFAGRALTSLAGSLGAAARGVIAWRQIAPMFHAAAVVEPPTPFVGRNRIRTDETTRLIDASDLVFRYASSGRPILKGVSLAIARGDRLLVEGGSGSGKSTLASLLVGLRQPGAGLLLLNGHDRQSLGEAWHEFATEAPQFHDNHILSGSLAFNLLMGRNWPARAEDLAEARAVCEELGLGDLIARMPGGLHQVVGETGWQLSHGERSRIFLARALLQDAELTILDESFAALDPEILQLCLDCAFRRARTLVVIAHP